MITNDNTICRFLSYKHFLTVILSFVDTFLSVSLSLMKFVLQLLILPCFVFYHLTQILCLYYHFHLESSNLSTKLSFCDTQINNSYYFGINHCQL